MTWNNLNIRQKSDIMKTCLQNGISSLDNIRAAYNRYAEGGYILEEIPPEEQALQRANRVYSNYESAIDEPVRTLKDYAQLEARKVLRFMQEKNLNPIGSGISNCTLTATQWINPQAPIKKAASIFNAPQKYNYTPITEEEAVPGNLVLARNPHNNTFHTMMISGFTDEGGIFNFNGKPYRYEKGEPLVNYSAGGHSNDFLRKDIPLKVFMDNSEGKSEKYYYRYNYPNERYLPEVVVTPSKNYFKYSLSL